MHKLITSRDNPRFRHLKRLAESGRERRKSGQTLLDGPHLLRAYADAYGAPRQFIVAQDAATPEIAALLAGFSAVETLVLPPALFAELSPVATPSGLLALIDIPPHAHVASVGFGLLLEDIQDPGNLGSLLRSAAAAGVEQAWLSPGCADAWSPKALRGGQGAQFILPVVEHADLVQVARAFLGETLATSPHGASLYGVDLTGAVAFLVGNEGAGLSPALMEAASLRVAIPMPGRMESLNAAAAAAVCLFERVRQQAARA